MDKKKNRQASHYFSNDEKHRIIQEMLSAQRSKHEIWEKYTGQSHDHGGFLRWMRQLGYSEGINSRRASFATNHYSMPKKKKAENPISSEDSFENLQLKKRIAELEKQLKDAELKAIAFSTMVDIAEKQFKIPIRKKFNTKP
jgi:transposase